MYSIQNSKTTEFINFNHIYQIGYSESSKKQCFRGFQLLENNHLSPFFENTAILGLFETRFKYINSEDWVGVLSPKFFQKAQSFKPITAIDLDKFLSETKKDVVGFSIRQTQRNIILQGDKYHKDFSKVFKMIIEKAGIDYDIRRGTKKLFVLQSGHQVYANIFSNAVIAKKWVYEKYIKEVLKPCYEVMSDPNNTDIQEIIWKDSGYTRLTRRDTSGFKAQIGVNYYPYHTFICERFWTMFLNMNDLQITQYPYV